MPTRPYPIADPRNGLFQLREPWLAPDDSFATMRNMQVYNGRIEKRPGLERFARIVEVNNPREIGTTTTSQNYAFDLSELSGLIVNETIRIEVGDPAVYTLTPAVAMTDRNDLAFGGNFSLTGDGFGDWNAYHGDLNLTLSSPPSAGLPINAFYTRRVESTGSETFTISRGSATETSGGRKRVQIQPSHFRPDHIFDLDDNDAPVLWGTLTLTCGSATVTADGPFGGWDYDSWTGDIDPSTGGALNDVWRAFGRIRVDLDPALVDDGDIWTLQYQIAEGAPVVALANLQTEDSEHLYAVTREQASMSLYKYVEGNARFETPDGGPYSVTGSAGATVTWTPAVRNLFGGGGTNDGNEVIALAVSGESLKRIDPNDDTSPDPVGFTDWTGDANGIELRNDQGEPLTRYVDTVRLVAQHQGSLILVDINEDGARKIRRARWSIPGSQEFFREFDFADAPTSERPRAIRVFKRRLFVGFESSIWELEFTGDQRGLYRWVGPIDDKEGAISPNAITSRGRAMYSFSAIGPLAFDGQQSQDIGRIALNRFIDNVNIETAFNTVQANRIASLRQIWFAYPALAESENTQVLALSEDGNQMSTFDMRVPCSTLWHRNADRIVDDITDIIVDEWDRIVDAGQFTAGYPSTVIGGRGQVLIYPGSTHSDVETGDYEIELETSGLNPFLHASPPRRARMQALQIYYQVVDGETCEVSIFRDDDAQPFTIFDMDLSSVAGVTGATRSWQMLHVNEEAFQFRIRIRATNARYMAFDAIVPWFSEGGPILNV